MKRIGLILIFFILFVQVKSQSNYYDLSVGTIRYYNYCDAYYLACTGAYSSIGIEEVLGDTLIDSKLYSVINWKTQIWNEDSIINNEKIFFYRFENGFLYKYTIRGDSILQNFNFSRGDSINNYYTSTELSVFFETPPIVIFYDTIIHFSDDSKYRIMWGDDTTHIYNLKPTIIPSIQTFLDSILIDIGENWILPFGDIQTYYPNKPFYFVDSLGVLYSEWNYRKMALVGIEKSNGSFYGRKINFITNIDNPMKELKSFKLFQNYPNPFNSSTHISFQLSVPSKVEVSIFNLLGQKITILFDGNKKAGSHTIDFNASELSSGIYLYKITTKGQSMTRKMLYVR